MRYLFITYIDKLLYNRS